jgi:hypothetical protein
MFKDKFRTNPLLMPIEQKSTDTLNMLCDFLPAYQKGPLNKDIFNGQLCTLMRLGVKLEDLVTSDTVWDVVNEPQYLPTLGLDHTISCMSNKNPKEIHDLSGKEYHNLDTGKAMKYINFTELSNSTEITNVKSKDVDLVVQEIGS